MRIQAAPGVSAHIYVDDHPLHEYNDPAEGQDEYAASAYIESVPGAKFMVRTSLSDKSPWSEGDMLWSIYLDGKCVRRTASETKQKFRTFLWSFAESPNGTAWQKMYFSFAALETSDSSKKETSSEMLSQLGMIVITAHRGKLRHVTPTDPNLRPNPIPMKATVDEPVHEKALKGRAISNRTALIPGEPVRPTPRVHFDYTWGVAPSVKFTFRYRSRRDLQIEGIIPRSLSPPALEERELDDLSLEETRELIRRMQAREGDKIKFERRVDDDGVDNEVEIVHVVKRERDNPIVIEDSDESDDEEPSAKRQKIGDDGKAVQGGSVPP